MAFNCGCGSSCIQWNLVKVKCIIASAASLVEDSMAICIVFLSEWGKFVPAIIRYCEKSKKKTLLDCAKEMDYSGVYKNGCSIVVCITLKL